MIYNLHDAPHNNSESRECHLAVKLFQIWNDLMLTFPHINYFISGRVNLGRGVIQHMSIVCAECKWFIIIYIGIRKTDFQINGNECNKYIQK